MPASANGATTTMNPSEDRACILGLWLQMQRAGWKLAGRPEPDPSRALFQLAALLGAALLGGARRQRIAAFEAAQITLHAGWRSITIVPLDATTATKVTPELVHAATSSDTLLARYIAKYAQPGFPMWDEIAPRFSSTPASPRILSGWP